MVLPVQTFSDPRLSQPIQESPLLSGLKTGMGLAGQLQKMQEQAKMAPIKRQLTQEQAHQASAETAFTQARAQGLPLEDAIKAAQTAETSSRFGSGYTFARMLMAAPAHQRSTWITNNPEKYKALLMQLGQKASTEGSATAGQTGAMGIVNRLLAQQYPGMYQAPPTASPQQAMQLGQQQLRQAGQPTPTLDTQQQVQQVPQAAAQTGQQQPGAPSQVRVSAIPPVTQWQDIPEPVSKSVLTEDEQFAMSSNQDKAGGDAWKRAVATSGAEYMLGRNRDKYTKMFDLASQYAGAYGRGKQYLNQWTNTNPNAVEAYRMYTNSFVPAIKNIIKRIEGMGATDQQRNELEKMSNQIEDVRSNPSQAKKGFNNMVSILHDVAESNYRQAEPVTPGIFSKIAGARNWESGNYLGLPKGKKGIMSVGTKGTGTANNDPLGIR